MSGIERLADNSSEVLLVPVSLSQKKILEDFIKGLGIKSVMVLREVILEEVLIRLIERRFDYLISQEGELRRVVLETEGQIIPSDSLDP